jgi:hypothetical protein
MSRDQKRRTNPALLPVGSVVISKPPTATPAAVNKQIDEYLGIADRALVLDLIPEDGEQLFFHKKLLEWYAPPLVQALDELKQHDCAKRPKSKTLLYCLLRALNAAYGIGSLACRSESGDRFAQREKTASARATPRKRRLVWEKTMVELAADWNGRHPTTKANEIAEFLEKRFGAAKAPTPRTVYNHLKKMKS